MKRKPVYEERVVPPQLHGLVVAEGLLPRHRVSVGITADVGVEGADAQLVLQAAPRALYSFGYAGTRGEVVRSSEVGIKVTHIVAYPYI